LFFVRLLREGQLARLLNVFDKPEAKGIEGDAAVAEAEERLAIASVPKATAADERPVRRREQGGPGPISVRCSSPDTASSPGRA
jgi:hypothetical protein